MHVFLGTLAVFAVCSLLLGLGMLIDRRKLQGGCGHKPEGAPRCADCPNSGNHPEKSGGSE
jgi:hypothetical protein